MKDMHADTRKGRRSRGSVACALVAAALAGVLAATGAAAVSAGNPGFGVVRAKDSATQTLLVGTRTVVVTDRTQLTGLEGQRIEFADIPSYPEGKSGYMVEYEVQGQGNTLEWLRVIETPR